MNGLKHRKEYDCPICGNKFVKVRIGQKTCFSGKCALQFVREEKKLKAEKASRKILRERKAKLKTKATWDKEAQAAFNKYIRVRDQGKPCISCGIDLTGSDFYLTGSATDASHYRSRGAASHLKFNLFNVNSSCTRCNRQLSGNVVEYRINLIKRIGIDRVESLENNNSPRVFDIEYLKRIKSIFTRRARNYQKINNRKLEAA